MGCAQSKVSSELNGTKNNVDQMLEEAKEEEQYHNKILLLGAGESGKSTVVKQIKMIYKVGGGITERERNDYTSAIRRNAIEVMQVLLEASKSLNIPISDSDLLTDAKEISALGSDAELTPDLGVKISSLWKDPGIQAVYARRDEFWLLDATNYFLNEVVRISSDDYELTEDDMIMTRIRTTGIVITSITENPYSYDVVDVGGQRSERRKWIHCFDDVRAIIFLEGLSGYNQVLFEDSTVNRMQESLQLFEEIVKNPLFKNTPIFVFLNKKDLFEEMIPKTSLKVCFPEYDGPDGEVRPAVEFIENRYKKIMAENQPGKQVYIQVIAARVRMDMKIAFGEVKETLKKIYSIDNKRNKLSNKQSKKTL
eukprot:gene10023-20867_t